MTRTRSLLLIMALSVLASQAVIGCSAEKTHTEQTKAFKGGPAPPGAVEHMMQVQKAQQPNARKP